MSIFKKKTLISKANIPSKQKHERWNLWWIGKITTWGSIYRYVLLLLPTGTPHICFPFKVMRFGRMPLRVFLCRPFGFHTHMYTYTHVHMRTHPYKQYVGQLDTSLEVQRIKTNHKFHHLPRAMYVRMVWSFAAEKVCSINIIYEYCPFFLWSLPPSPLLLR